MAQDMRRGSWNCMYGVRLMRGLDSGILLLLLCPHLLTTHRIVVINRASAMRSLHCCLLIVHGGSSSVSTIVDVWRIGVLIGLRWGNAIMRRLPPAERSVHVRAVVTACILLLAIGGRRFQYVRGIITRRRIGSERRAALRSIRWHRVLYVCRRLWPWRRLHSVAHVHRNHGGLVHCTHVVIRSRSLSLLHWRPVHCSCWRGRGLSVGLLRHGGLRITRKVVLLVRASRALVVNGSTGGQSGSSGSLRLLNGAGMMILMARERSAAGKRLLTVGVWALVRPLTRVNASMAGKRAGV